MRKIVRGLTIALTVVTLALMSTNMINCGYDQISDSECEADCNGSLGYAECNDACGPGWTHCTGTGSVDEGGGCSDDECNCDVASCQY